MKNVQLVVLINKTTPDLSQILLYAKGRVVELFSATRRPAMLNTSANLEKIFKVKATEEDFLDLYDLNSESLDEFKVFDKVKQYTGVVVFVLNSMAVPLVQAKLNQMGYSFPHCILMTEEIAVIDLKQLKVEVLNKKERYALFY